MSTHNICFCEAFLMSTHNICFHGEIREISAFFGKKRPICCCEYWDTLSTYHTCPKIRNSPLYYLLMYIKFCSMYGKHCRSRSEAAFCRSRSDSTEHSIGSESRLFAIHTAIQCWSHPVTLVCWLVSPSFSQKNFMKFAEMIGMMGSNVMGEGGGGGGGGWVAGWCIKMISLAGLSSHPRF